MLVGLAAPAHRIERPHGQRLAQPGGHRARDVEADVQPQAPGLDPAGHVGHGDTGGGEAGAHERESARPERPQRGVPGSLARRHDVTVGALEGRAASEPRCFDSSTVGVATGGADNAIGGGLDDVITIVSGVGGTPLVETVAILGDANNTTSQDFVPTPLGGGRA